MDENSKDFGIVNAASRAAATHMIKRGLTSHGLYILHRRTFFKKAPVWRCLNTYPSYEQALQALKNVCTEPTYFEHETYEGPY